MRVGSASSGIDGLGFFVVAVTMLWVLATTEERPIEE
jgi:hypothetical protein